MSSYFPISGESDSEANGSFEALPTDLRRAVMLQALHSPRQAFETVFSNATTSMHVIICHLTLPGSRGIALCSREEVSAVTY